MTRDVVHDCESARADRGHEGWRFRSCEIAVAVVVLVGLTTAGVLAATALRALAANVSSLNTDLARMKQGRDLEWQLQEDRRRFLAMLAAGILTAGNENPAMQPALGVSSPEIGAYRSVEQEAIGLIQAHRIADAQGCEVQRGRKLFNKALWSAHSAVKAADEDSARRWDALDGSLQDMALAGGIFLLVALTGTTALVLRERLRSRSLHFLSKRNRELRSASGWERERNRILELIGNNQSLEVICDAIVGSVESRHGHVCCGIAIVRQGKLGLVSARRLSTTMVGVLNGSGGEGGSSPSQLAFHSGKPVLVKSIATDPLWQGQREELLAAGFVSSWSLPLQSNAGYTLGAITLFAEKKPAGERTAESDEDRLESLEIAAGMASLAVQHRKVYEQLTYQAQHDSVTELPNRILFQERITKAVAAADTGGSIGFAILLLDLDDFKQVNDTLGHAAGDALLRQVAHRLRQLLRASDTVARLGGDEFAILLNQIGNYADAGVVVDKVLEALRAPLRLPGKPVVLTASIGVSVHPEDGRDAATLLKNADMAMYRAKRAGKDKAERFLQRMADEMNDRMEMDSRLRTALANREFNVVYQPELRPDGTIVAFEALLRWNSPTLGKVLPIQFIPVAESSGLIVPIGTWVLREACRQCVAWQKTTLPGLRMAVNMSVVQLEQQDVAETVRQVLLETGLDPACLQLEITESYLVRDADEAKVQLRSLRSLGLKIAIDDFGTGYSSLSYLRHLPVDTLKIDRSFIVDLASNRSSRSVVQAIIGMAHGLSMNVVAEGVETCDQLEALSDLGCDLLQGYLFSRPLPASDFDLRALSHRYSEVLSPLAVAG